MQCQDYMGLAQRWAGSVSYVSFGLGPPLSLLGSVQCLKAAPCRMFLLRVLGPRHNKSVTAVCMQTTKQNCA